MPSDPWPHDMVIAVNDGDHLLLPLLFINEAWQLRATRIPSLNPPPDVGGSHRPDTATVDEWRLRWRDAWGQAVAAAGVKPEPPADAESAKAWFRDWVGQMPKPFTQVWGDAGFDRDAYNAWVSALRPPDRHHRPLDEQPERRALPALIGAWQRGLRTVVTLPFARHWSAQGGPHHLLIAEMTREDTDRYSTRLELFGTMPPGNAPAAPRR
ncbi:hypothetical protein ACFFGH_10680 [Lysobacter korlensis]|uniref:Uncharacterized protein n=1 Tax=Lysobacter korlensis TaxID=553636 RepID=A0ABV6RMU4_9GAMM